MIKRGNKGDEVKSLQIILSKLGYPLVVDGDFGPKTQEALREFQVKNLSSELDGSQVGPATALLLKTRVNEALEAHKQQKKDDEIGEEYTHLHPVDCIRQQLGQKEILGKEDNPFIRKLHTHCANIGSKEYPDEVAWCSSLINWAADMCGMEKTDNALAASWDKYGEDSGDIVEEGDIVTIAHPGRHVTLANKTFNRKTDKTFEGIGGNQSNMIKVSTYSCATIKACRKWKPKPGTKTRPIKGKVTASTGDGSKESTR